MFLKGNNIWVSSIIVGVLVVVLDVVIAAQLSDAELVALAKQDVDSDSERLFEYVKTTQDGLKLGCKGKVKKGDTGKVSALFIEDARGRRELKRLAPVSAKYKNYLNVEEDRFVPLRDFPMYCLERVFTSSSCPPGPPGRPGRDGRNGTIGFPGGPGLPGINGTPGYDAIPGVKGPPGPRGPDGEKGDRGPNGPPGPQGCQGLPGPKGPDGNDGVPGVAGPAGEPGLPGPDGTPGVDGTDGVDGAAGPPGIPGLNGIPGPNGIPGIPGFSGNNGFDGVDAGNGQNGIDGANGKPGHCCTGLEECHDENENIGLVEDEVAAVVHEEHPTIEEENVKNKPSHSQKPSSSSFWLSNTDVFSIGSLDFKNKHMIVNKNMKESTVNEADGNRLQKEGVHSKVPVLIVPLKTPLNKNIEKHNELSA